MKDQKLSGERIVNLCLFLASAFYLAYSLTHYKVGTVRMPKEGFMPMLVGGGAVIVSALLTVQSFMGKGDAKDVKLSFSWLRFLCLIGVSLLYALTMSFMGYMLGSFLFLFIVFKIARLDGWIKPAVISLISSVAFYLIFKVALGVMLPVGFLGV